MKEFIEKLIGRLEEREAELKNITAECKPTKEIRDKNYGYYTAMNHAKEIANQLAEEYNDGWIPCSERLPEAKKEVLIYADDNAVFIGRLMNGGFSVHDGDGWIDLKYILAWQPLPSPYQPKGE